jgi:hypothetical protein
MTEIKREDVIAAPDYSAVRRIELLRESHKFAVSVGEDARASKLADTILDRLMPEAPNTQSHPGDVRG